MDNLIDELDLTKELCKLLKNIPSVDKKYIFCHMNHERVSKSIFFNNWKSYKRKR
tara:strand:- start:354 stop:518 length:165 start_codon:yes stop_codon:yes gene_type:complete